MLERSEDSGIVTLRLSHGKASALDLEFVEALREQFDAFAAGPPRAVIVTGSGSIFSAGVDLFRLVDGGPGYVRRFLPALETMFESLLAIPCPVIAAINGHAIAGGCLIAQGCDVRVMAKGKGRIGVPELRVGLPFPPVAVEMLRARISPSHLSDVLYRGDTYLPDDALQRGLIDDVIEPESLDQAASEVAQRLAAAPPKSFALTRQMLFAPVIEAARRAAHHREAVEMIWSSEEAAMSIRNYLETTVGRRE